MACDVNSAATLLGVRRSGVKRRTRNRVCCVANQRGAQVACKARAVFVEVSCRIADNILRQAR